MASAKHQGIVSKRCVFSPAWRGEGRGRGGGGCCTFRLQVGSRPQFEGERQQRLLEGIELEVLHEGGEIEVAEYVLGAGLDGLGDLPGLGELPGQLPHLGDEQMVVARVCYGPVEAREYLGGICGHQSREVPREHIHAVFIDELGTDAGQGQQLAGTEHAGSRRKQAGGGARRRGGTGSKYLPQGFELRLPLARIVLVLLDGAEEQVDLGDCNLGQGA